MNQENYKNLVAEFYNALMDFGAEGFNRDEVIKAMDEAFNMYKPPHTEEYTDAFEWYHDGCEVTDADKDPAAWNAGSNDCLCDAVECFITSLFVPHNEPWIDHIPLEWWTDLEDDLVNAIRNKLATEIFPQLHGAKGYENFKKIWLPSAASEDNKTSKISNELYASSNTTTDSAKVL